MLVFRPLLFVCVEARVFGANWGSVRPQGPKEVELIHCNRLRSPRVTSDVRGASMVEFVIAFPLLVLMFLFLIDFGRYQLAKGVLQHVTDYGAREFATQPNIDYDLEGLDSSSSEYQAFDEARNYIIGLMTQRATSMLFTDISTPSSMQLEAFTIYDATLTGNGTVPETEAAVGVIMPKERIGIGPPSSVTGYIDHPTLAPGSTTPLPREKQLERHPIVVTMRALIQMFNPFMGNVEVVSTVLAYREKIARGPVAASGGGGSGGPVTTTTMTTTTVTTSSTTSTTWACNISQSGFFDKWNDCFVAGLGSCPKNGPGAGPLLACQCEPCNSGAQ